MRDRLVMTGIGPCECLYTRPDLVVDGAVMSGVSSLFLRRVCVFSSERSRLGCVFVCVMGGGMAVSHGVSGCVSGCVSWGGSDGVGFDESGVCVGEGGVSAGGGIVRTI